MNILSPSSKTGSGLSCPCGQSSDAFYIQANGWGKCFSGKCGGKNFPPEQVQKYLGGKPIEQAEVASGKSAPNTTSKELSPITEVFRPWPERGLSRDTIQKYKVQVGQDGDPFDAKCPRFDLNGRHVANKVRTTKEKGEGCRFFFEGDKTNAEPLFGQHLFPPGGKFITITEGYEDAMAVHQMFGGRYPAVSVESSAAALGDCKRAFEYLNSFETIVVAFDNDEPGRNAAKQVASCGFPLGKVKILTLRKHKDANEYLKAKESEAFTREWWQAPDYKPDGLLLGSDAELLDSIINYKEPESIPLPWKGLNKMLYGLRLGELTLFTADTGVGKTTFMKEIEYCILSNEELKERKYGVGFMHLEEPIRDTAIGLMSIHNNKPYHLPDTEKTTEELTQAYNEVVNNDRVVIYDHFGSNSIDVVLDKVRHMSALGCKYIVLDHLSIIVSDQSGDERKQLDEISTKLKTLTMNLNICLICVIHINRQGLVRGSAGPEQVANNVIRLERDKKETDEWRRNITKITVEKCRLSGRTGPASWVWYNPSSGRLTELEPEEAQIFEGGGSIMEADKPWKDSA